MMKKRICSPLLLAAMLSMTACTEVLEPNVDYGGNTYINDYTALVKAVNDLQKSLEDRFDALNTLLKAGMLDMKLAIDENTGAIKVLEATTKSGLASIDTSLINGFNAISTSVDTAGNKIVTALDDNGNLLRLTIDSNGSLLNTSLVNLGTKLDTIAQALTDHNASFNEKISALNELLTNGLAEVNINLGKLDTDLKGIGTTLDLQKAELVKMNTNLDNVNTNLKNIETGLGDLKTELNSGLTVIGNELDTYGNKIVTAMNTQGEAIEVAINKQGEAIKVAIVDLDTKLDENLGNLITAQGNLKAAIENLSVQEKANAESIVAAIEKMMNDDGIYSSQEGDKDVIYMDYQAWAAIEDKTESSVYKGIMESLTTYQITVHAAQKVDDANLGMPAPNSGFYGKHSYYDTYHDHCDFTEVSRGEDILVGGNYGVQEDAGTTKKVFKVIRIPGNIKYNAATGYKCGKSRIYKYAIKDARGIYTVDVSSTSVTKVDNIELVTYSNGKIADRDIKLIVYCYDNATVRDSDFDYSTLTY